MNTVRKIIQSDETATVTLHLPVSTPGRQFEVVVVWQEVDAVSSPSWPPGWFEATEGSIDDPTFTRGAQGQFEQREHFE